MIDAHHHLWNYDPVEYAWIGDQMSVLRRDFTPADLHVEMSAAGVTGAIAVQARQSIEETEWLLDLASRNTFLLGVVGWVHLCDAENLRRQLDRFAGHTKLKGVRHVLQDEPDDNFMLRRDFLRGIAALAGTGLVYDILIYERHLPQTLRFVDQFPNQVFVLDHLAKPRIREHVLQPWADNLRELARRANVFCKLSGMATEADWNHWSEPDLRPYFETALHAFGPSRLMFGSDWPVLEVAGSYGGWASMVHGWVERLTRSEQEAILSGTARRAYRLDC